MAIIENLTKKKVIELKKARKLYNFKDVWSHEAKFLFLVINDWKEVKVFHDQYLNSKHKDDV